MKKIIIVVAFCAAIISCTEAGEGSNTTTDSSAVKDKTMDATSGGDASSKDTTSYERMPSKPTDTTKN